MELQIKNLDKSFKNKKILNDVNLTLNTNKIYGLLGLNGVGKTTLIKCIFNELNYEKGEVLVDNHLLGFDDYKKMYYFPENDDLPNNMTIYEYLYRVYIFAKKNKDNFEKELEAKLGILKSLNIKKTKISSLSTGQKKIVSIVACLLNEPKIIIFDEPTANLDIANKETILNMIKKLKNEDTVIVLTTHLIEEVHKYLDHVIILSQGHVAVDTNINNQDVKKIFLEAVEYDENKLYE